MAGDAQLSTQNMSFQDMSPGQVDTRGTNMDSTRDVGFMDDTSLPGFFSRPIRILEVDWEIGTPLFQRFNPWTLFWENARVAEKIKNYHLLKCNLHVKLILNGNAFYYGRAIMAYEPLVNFDNTSPEQILRPNAYVQQDVTRLSQRMHVYINPTDSTGGSLELPFFWDKNALIIPDNEWQDVGDLVLMSINDLQHVNGGVTNVTISVLAWAENVSYSIPTANVPEMGDEHDMNIVSRPASAVARVAGALSNVPWIGPFARATEMGANTIASIAKIFGYSSPTELDYNVMVPTPRNTLATYDAKYPTNKLSLDSKQEVTIDPATTGIRGDDEMPIASIAGRESYLTTFDWNISDAVDAKLFEVRVDPFMFRSYAAGSSLNERHLTACAAAALPFKYWRGSMRFRFQIVSSNYHKGRLRLVYNPHGGVLNPQFNTHYTTIHDISSEKDFTVDIGWAQDEPYREHIWFLDTPFTTNTLSPLSGLFNKTNGVLGVYVMNDLTVPGSVVANIQVNVFVSMLEDFEVAQPTSRVNEMSFRQLVEPPEMAEMLVDPFRVGGEQLPNIPEMAYNIPEMDTMGDADCCDTPVTDPPTIDQMADLIIDTPDTTKLFFGEVIGSFRQLMKRTCLAEVTQASSSGSANTLITISRGMFPDFGGTIPSATVLKTNSLVVPFIDTRKVVPIATTYINYVSRMFVGWRGSVRWTFDFSTLDHVAAGGEYKGITPLISRVDGSPSTNAVQVLPFSGDSRNTRINLTNSMGKGTLLGSHLAATSVNPICSIEVPFYSNKRFYYTFEDQDYTASSLTPYQGWEYQYIYPQTDANSPTPYIKHFVSAGEDLNFFFFNGMPPLYWQEGLPVDTGA